MQLYGFWRIWHTIQSNSQILVSYKLHRLPETAKMKKVPLELKATDLWKLSGDLVDFNNDGSSGCNDKKFRKIHSSYITINCFQHDRGCLLGIPSAQPVLM
jgi:hypothetical protein